MGIPARLARAVRRRPAREIPPLEQISFTGMRDNPDPSSADPRKATLLQNVYPIDPEVGGATVGRPGFSLLGAQGGSLGNRRGQRTYEYVKNDGTTYRVRFVGGVMQTLDWGTGVWSTVAYGGGVAVDASAVIHCLTYTNQMVVTDGVNTPWMWDGTAFTLLTNWPVVYGPMTVYYAKLFGIKASDRKTFVWCEENDPNTGMEAGGYNNAWDFVQTSSARLTLLLGTNEALIVYRERATEYVLGEVSDDFRSTGTRSGVSDSIGTNSPFAVIQGSKIFTLDADGHPQVMIGLSYLETPIWEDARETLRRIPRDKLTKACACYYEPASLVLFGIAGLLADEPDRILVYDAHRNEFVGIWRWGSAALITSLDMVTDASARPTLIHLSDDGYSYKHGNPDGDIWNDELASGTVSIQHIIEGSPLGYSTREEKSFHVIHLSMRLSSTLGDMQITYTTPYGVAPEQSIALTDAGFSVWGGTTWGGGVWGSASNERHLAVGINGTGRWVKPRIRHSGLSEQFGLVGLSVEATLPGSANEAR